MTSVQFLFEAASELTGGLITDLKTVYLAGVVLAFLLIGFDHLKESFENMMASRSHSHHLDQAKQLRWEMDHYEKGSAEWDEANYSYRQTISKAAKARSRMK